jgi:hypothetical protein
MIAMDAVNREDDKNGKVRNQNRDVESVGLIDALEGILVKDVPEVANHGVRVGNENGKE